eukprot:CAMPEP_0113936066 /NCGR_PEP_ID=MMETSP1339-20121228/3058_1 /TAXON_ID=94617 /ORGANISM="Fibrocapsa japonica" /LENGTH=175 /DNA_ID=CAMNT_0000938405 /DNA_START=113 /DNA_END=640 /DNA_ORIENTATION=+ /assembly_acc=CAM_ASM_000762
MMLLFLLVASVDVSQSRKWGESLKSLISSEFQPDWYPNEVSWRMLVGREYDMERGFFGSKKPRKIRRNCKLTFVSYDKKQGGEFGVCKFSTGETGLWNFKPNGFEQASIEIFKLKDKKGKELPEGYLARMHIGVFSNGGCYLDKGRIIPGRDQSKVIGWFDLRGKVSEPIVQPYW